MAFLLHVAKDFVVPVRVCVCVNVSVRVSVCVCLALPAWCEFILQTITVKKHVYIAQIHAHTHTHTHTYLSPHIAQTVKILTYTLTLPYIPDSHARPLGQSLLRHPPLRRLASLARPLCREPLCGCMCVCVLVEGYSILTLAHTATKGSKVGHERLANTL